MTAQDEKLHKIFFRQFAHDHSKFLIPRLPYYDRFACRRVMDYAIYSQDPSVPKVAILIRPEAEARSDLQQIALEDTIRALTQINWIPLVFNPSDFEARSWYVRQQLEGIFSTYEEPIKKPKHKAGFFKKVMSLITGRRQAQSANLSG
jgi:hypothetical protein